MALFRGGRGADPCVDRLPTSREIAAVCELANELGIAPSIVLGQAQRLTGDYAWGHALKVRFEWETEAEQVA